MSGWIFWPEVAGDTTVEVGGWVSQYSASWQRPCCLGKSQRREKFPSVLACWFPSRNDGYQLLNRDIQAIKTEDSVFASDDIEAPLPMHTSELMLNKDYS